MKACDIDAEPEQNFRAIYFEYLWRKVFETKGKI
jgi:hypothetical protein